MGLILMISGRVPMMMAIFMVLFLFSLLFIRAILTVLFSYFHAFDEILEAYAVLIRFLLMHISIVQADGTKGKSSSLSAFRNFSSSDTIRSTSLCI
ncbi:MAG: hypothetical protein PWP14_1999 [Methanolobus sp.]|nr:hypothetical protein [Methanolobus sp.]